MQLLGTGNFQSIVWIQRRIKWHLVLTLPGARKIFRKLFLFRPPYGAYDNAVIKTAYQMNYYPIQWSVDSLDWKDYGVDSIIDTVCNHKALGPGAIILCHNGAKYTAEALDTMLTQLEEKGYTIVPISELIMRENYHMDVSGKQIADE